MKLRYLLLLPVLVLAAPMLAGEPPSDLLETGLVIPAKGDPVTTRTTLDEGIFHVITIEGTFIYDHGERGQIADAVYEEQDDGSWQKRFFVSFDGHGWPPDSYDLENHVYHYVVKGEGRPMSLRIEDFNPLDNVGGLNVTIHRAGPVDPRGER